MNTDLLHTETPIYPGRQTLGTSERRHNDHHRLRMWGEGGTGPEDEPGAVQGSRVFLDTASSRPLSRVSERVPCSTTRARVRTRIRTWPCANSHVRSRYIVA